MAMPYLTGPTFHTWAQQPVDGKQSNNSLRAPSSTTSDAYGTSTPTAAMGELIGLAPQYST
eukprot:231598-Pelagomonas_calceolata.AAC.12